jgi:hypothetical protein
MAQRRRRTHQFYATRPDGTEGIVNAKSYGKDAAFALLEALGYSNIEPYKPAPKCEFDKDAIIALARSWGIRWDIKITVRDAPKGGKNGSVYAQQKGNKLTHYVVLSPLCAEPERTVRHELGHMLYNEQEYANLGYDFMALSAASDKEHADYDYKNRPTEVFARSQENRDLHKRISR